MPGGAFGIRRREGKEADRERNYVEEQISAGTTRWARWGPWKTTPGTAKTFRGSDWGGVAPESIEAHVVGGHSRAGGPVGAETGGCQVCTRWGDSPLWCRGLCPSWRFMKAER